MGNYFVDTIGKLSGRYHAGLNHAFDSVSVDVMWRMIVDVEEGT